MKKLILLFALLFATGSLFAQQTLYRYYNEQTHKHYFTIDFNEYGNGRDGWFLDGPACVVFDHEDRDRGVVPLFQYFNPKIGDHYYTTHFQELGRADKGYYFEKPACYISRFKRFRTVPLFSYFNPSTGDHFYTIDQSEIGPGFAGYQFIGVTGFVFPAR